MSFQYNIYFKNFFSKESLGPVLWDGWKFQTENA